MTDCLTQNRSYKRSNAINIINNGISDNNNNKYLFELFIQGKNIKKTYFKKIENKKHSNLIDIYDNILLSDIDNYKIKLTITNNNDIIEEYIITDNINHNKSNTTNNNGSLYVEFINNNNGYAMCNSIYFKSKSLFISPPN